MSVQEIEKAIAALPQHDLAQLEQWFEQFRAEEQSRLWDEQIARDAKAGRLDALAAQAMEDFDAGKYHLLVRGKPLTP